MIFGAGLIQLSKWKFSFVLIMLSANAVARGTIFILSFYAFWSQPESVYHQIGWSQFFPFIG